MHFAGHHEGETLVKHRRLVAVRFDTRPSEEMPGDRMQGNTIYPSKIEARTGKAAFAPTRMNGDSMRAILEPRPAGRSVLVASTTGWA